MIKRKEDMRLQVRENLRGGNGIVKNYHIFEQNETGDRFELFTKFVFEPGVGIGYHEHIENCEAYYVLEGELTLVENGVETVLRPGDASFVAHGSHSIENRTDKTATMLAVIIKA